MTDDRERATHWGIWRQGEFGPGRWFEAEIGTPARFVEWQAANESMVHDAAPRCGTDVLAIAPFIRVPGREWEDALAKRESLRLIGLTGEDAYLNVLAESLVSSGWKWEPK